MNNKIIGGLTLTAAGFIVGSLAQMLYDEKKYKRLYESYEKENERANELVRKCNQLDLDLRQCKLTNWQVGQYATQLKRQLDHFME